MLRNDGLGNVVHKWLRDVIFFIGASWYSVRKEVKVIPELSNDLELSWILEYGLTKLHILQRWNASYRWLTKFSIGNSNPFILDCFIKDNHPTDEEMESIEAIVLLYLPNIEILRCSLCGRRSNNSRLDNDWYCSNCLSDFAHENKIIDTAGSVYIFGSNEHKFFKIGYGNTPFQRMSDYKSSKLPFSIEMLHVIPCDNKVKAEAELHRLFHDKRTNGEWFRLDENDIEKILGLKKYVNGKWLQ